MNKARRKPHKIKSKKSIFGRRSFWLATLALIIIGTIFYFIVFYDKFQVKNIIISGNKKAATDSVESLVLKQIKKQVLFFNSQSIFLISPTITSNAIINNFPGISSAEVHRKLFNTLIINIKERVPAVIFCEPADISEKCFFLDEIGVAFEEAASAVRDFIIIGQNTKKEIILGKEAIKKDIINSIIKTKRILKDNFNVGIKEANIVSDERMNILTSEGWNVYFNLTSDMDLQITKLKLLLEKEIPQEGRGALDYIDLRFERAYICAQNSPCSK